MIKKHYHLYNPESDTLEGMNASEHELINLLQDSPVIKYTRIIEYYLNTVEDKHLAFERLDEIFHLYYRCCMDSITIIPFKYEREKIDLIFEILERLSLKNKKKSKVKNTFENLLVGEGKRLFPYLLKNFMNESPKKVTNMVMALIQMDMLPKSVVSNKRSFHGSLVNCFGSIGDKESFRQSILGIEKPTRKSEIARLVKEFKTQLLAHKHK